MFYRCGVFTDTFHHCGVLFTSDSLVFLGPPDAIKIQPREVREKTITVQWTPGFDGGRPITRYSIMIKDKQGNYTKITHTIKVEFGHLESNNVFNNKLKPSQHHGIQQ